MTSFKLLLTATALIACVYNAKAVIKSLPDNYKNAYASGSVPTLQAEMTIDTERLQTAYDAFVPVNASCHETANVSAIACGACVGEKCQERYNAVCPPPKPTVEPGCEELKANSSYYCLYYVDETICPECATDKDLCSDCALDKCTDRYYNVCPLDRPTSTPNCDQLKSNSSYYCLYYAVPEQCSSCTDLRSDACSSCIKSKCESRGKSECGDWFTDTVLFFKDDLPFFFETTVPEGFETFGTEVANLGEVSFNGVVNFGEDIGNGVDTFFTDLVPDLGVELGEGIDDLFTDIIPSGAEVAIDGLVDFGDLTFDVVIDPIGDAFVDFGDLTYDGLLDPIGTGLDDFVDIVDDGFDIVIDGLDDLFSGIDFGGLFGKRKRRSLNLRKLKKKIRAQRRRRSTPEPTCEEIQKDANAACPYYQDPLICADCGFDPDVDCVGWTTAVADLEYAIDQRKWMEAQQTDGSYSVTLLEYDTDKATLEPYTYTDLDVQLTLFGRDLRFVIPQPLDLRNATQAGEAIGKMAADLSRQAALST